MAVNDNPGASSLVVDGRALRAALKHVVQAVEARNTIPILSHVLIRADGDTIRLVASDLDSEVHARCALDAPVVGPFSATVGARVFDNIVAKLAGGGQVGLTLADRTLIVAAGRAHFTLPTLPATDFPIMPVPAWESEFELSAAALRRAIDQVRHAISSEETRYYLNGIHLDVLDGEVRFVATDGHRLALCPMPRPDGITAVPNIIVSRKMAGVILKLVDAARDDESVAMQLARGKLRVSFGAVDVVGKLIDAQFPDYRRVIPDNAGCARFDAAALKAAVARVAVVSAEKIVPVKIDVRADRLVLTVTSPENGSATEDIPCQFSGDDMTFSANGGYLTDILDRLEGDACEMRPRDAVSPVLFRSGAGDDAPVHVLMPRRV